MRNVLIGGIGNVLLGDDGVGPQVVHLLESQYAFGDDVEIADLGTPALDLTHQIAGLRAVILVDSVAGDATAVKEAPGTVVLYRKADIIRETPAQRLDPHSPALSECLLTAEMLGASPQHVLLVGIVGESYDPGAPLSTAVRQAIPHAIGAILEELGRLSIAFHKRSFPLDPDLWWGDNPPSEALHSL